MFEIVFGAFALIIVLLMIWMIRHTVKSTGAKNYTYTMKDGVETVETEE